MSCLSSGDWLSDHDTDFGKIFKRHGRFDIFKLEGIIASKLFLFLFVHASSVSIVSKLVMQQIASPSRFRLGSPAKAACGGRL